MKIKIPTLPTRLLLNSPLSIHPNKRTMHIMHMYRAAITRVRLLWSDTLDFVGILNGKNCRPSVTYAWSSENDHTKGLAGRSRLSLRRQSSYDEGCHANKRCHYGACIKLVIQVS